MSAPGYDVATALWQGARPYQEDTLLADFHGGMDRGFAVLADGMGGHAAGDLASRLVVIDAASHLKFLMHDGAGLEKTLKAELTSAIETANGVLRDRADGDRRLHGMGTTFLATVIFEDRLYWASVGDSPLYLWREGKLRQLNEDHSMAPVIDQMARAGEISDEEAANHPDRNALTSVLMGRGLKSMDVPETATVLDPGDVLIQASDGVQYLDEAEISRIVGQGGSSREIADALMDALRRLEDPTQDNTAILVLQLTATGAVKPMVAATSVGTTRAVDSPPSPPRAPTPRDVPRPQGARRWVVPAGLLAGAAVVTGLVFGLPGTQPGEELAAIAPVTEQIASADAPAVPSIGTTAASGGIAPTAFAPAAAPLAPDTAGALAHEALGDAPTEAASVAPTAPAMVADKRAQPAATPTAATIPFSAEAPEIIPQSEGISAPDPIQPAPQSERTRVPLNPLTKGDFSDSLRSGKGI